MGRAKKDEKPEIPSDDTELEQIFRDLCNDEWQALTLVNHLEGTSYSRYTNNKEDLSFCKSYTIALIQTYCKSTTWEETDNGDVKPKRIGSAEDKIEFVLAMFGLLKGFEFEKKSLGKRRRKYYDYAHGYNKLVGGAWDGASIDTILRDTLYGIVWELTNILHDLKTENGGILGLHSQVSKELNLPAPRGNSKTGKQPTTVLPDFIKQLIHMLKSIKSGHLYLCLSICLMVLFGFAIAASLIKLAFFPTVPLSVPETVNYPSTSSIPVEEIISEKSPFTVYPGLTIRLPLKISPDEADGTFLYCSSSDSNILYTEDGNKALVTALEIFDPKVPKAKVTVTVTPQNRASSDVFVEVPVIVDYRTYVSEPFN